MQIRIQGVEDECLLQLKNKNDSEKALVYLHQVK